MPWIVAPVIHLEFHYKNIDTVLAVGYAIATFFAFWVLCSSMNSATRDPASTGFFLLMSMTSLIRGVWYSTPLSVHVSGYVPQRLHVYEDGWLMVFISQFVEMAGTFFFYNMFVLMVVFWADILHR
jgi:hypothetical protein